MRAVVFPGQGSQKAGMGAPWVSSPSWPVVGQVSEVLGRDVAALLVGADAATLQATRNAQVAGFALGLVLLDAARRAGLTWDVAAGHSLGEYTALVSVGALEIEAAARLVGARADAMQDAADAAPGTMAAIVGLEQDVVAACCAEAGDAWMANDNAPGQIVVAGTHAGVGRAGDAAKARGGRALPLAVGGAFHSPLMATAQEPLDAALAAAPFADGAVDVVANVDAAPHRGATEWAMLLSRQLCQPVRWREGILRMADLGVTEVVELGPGAVLSGMVKRIAPDLARRSAATPDEIAGLAP